jgi:hypothetical protein
MTHARFFLRRLFLQICLFASVALTGCDDKNIRREDIGVFLTSYDPALKSKRDELVNALEATQQKIAKLQDLLSTYKSERAKGFVAKRLEVFERQQSKLSKLLEQIDAEVEVAMAFKAVDSADGGGLQTAETSRILTQADKLLSQSNQLVADVDIGPEGEHAEAADEATPATSDVRDEAEDGAPSIEVEAATGWLGVEMSKIDGGDYADMGIIIQRVYPASAADEAGLIGGDRIKYISFKAANDWGNLVDVRSMDVLIVKDEISRLKKGDEVKLVIERNDWFCELEYVITLGALDIPLKFDQGPKARAVKLASIMGQSSAHMSLRSFPLYSDDRDGDRPSQIIRHVDRGEFLVAPWYGGSSPVENDFGRLIYTALRVYLASGETGYVRMFKNKVPMLETIK